MSPERWFGVWLGKGFSGFGGLGYGGFWGWFIFWFGQGIGFMVFDLFVVDLGIKGGV